MAKKYQITISDDYADDIKEYDCIRIDDGGVVWYEYSYDNGRLGEDIPVGVMEKFKEAEWISTQDRLPDNDTDVFFIIQTYSGGEAYATLPCTGYFLDGKFCDELDKEYDYKPWNGKSKETIDVVEYWFPQPPLPVNKEN